MSDLVFEEDFLQIITNVQWPSTDVYALVHCWAPGVSTEVSGADLYRANNADPLAPGTPLSNSISLVVPKAKLLYERQHAEYENFEAPTIGDQYWTIYYRPGSYIIDFYGEPYGLADNGLNSFIPYLSITPEEEEYGDTVLVGAFGWTKTTQFIADDTPVQYHIPTFEAVYLIDLPRLSKPVTAFAVETSGTIMNIEIYLYPKKHIVLDASNTGGRFTAGDVGPQPNGRVYYPLKYDGKFDPGFSVDVAFCWDEYITLFGSRSNFAYPFAVTKAKHLKSPPAGKDPNVKDVIPQLYPKALQNGDVWSVVGYTDVPFGTTFRQPFEWSNLTVAEKPPLLLRDEA